MEHLRENQIGNQQRKEQKTENMYFNLMVYLHWQIIYIRLFIESITLGGCFNVVSLRKGSFIFILLRGLIVLFLKCNNLFNYSVIRRQDSTLFTNEHYDQQVMLCIRMNIEVSNQKARQYSSRSISNQQQIICCKLQQYPRSYFHLSGNLDIKRQSTYQEHKEKREGWMLIGK